ncbi:O-antigen ligase family protein [Novosphingobium colocasiae]|uniref:Ligase n=1 Tax=Novosphingobium colocasiae TaxID=1256513 RepID=A0A918UDG4_9SPHN|nr:O-antigen ligase family protein [Novosphingobium colocasiae]GGY96515.1 ligase [Novosphingobium colocasiae]
MSSPATPASPVDQPASVIESPSPSESDVVGGGQDAAGATAPSSDEGSRRRRRRPKTPDLAVRPLWLIVAFAALVGLSLLGPFMTYSSTDGTGGQLSRQIGYLTIAGLTVWAVHGVQVRSRLFVMPWPFIFALGWCWLSMTWAIEPLIAIRRVLLLTMVTWLIFIMVRQIGYRTSLLILRVLLTVLLAANWITVLSDPTMGIHQINESGDEGLVGDWRGMMEHKNIAGMTCALTVLLFTFDPRRMPIVIRFAVLAAAGAFLWLTQSRTSIAGCAAALVAGGLFSFYSYRWRPAIITLVIVLGGIGAIVQNVISDPFMRVTVDDPTTLSGRTIIWEALWAYYRNAPYFGAGYGSFWDIGRASPINQFGRGWLLEIAQGHNGYLDLLITIGPVGLGLCVYAAFVWPILRLLNWRRGDKQVGALLLSTLVFLIAHNATESTLFDRDSIGQVFVVLAAAMVFLVTRPGGRVPSGNVDLLAWATRDEDEPQPVSTARSGSRGQSRRRSGGGSSSGRSSRSSGGQPRSR